MKHRIKNTTGCKGAWYAGALSDRAGFTPTPSDGVTSHKEGGVIRALSNSAGFTLIELLVTLAVLAMFYGLVVANFANWRGPQYVKGAANELATAVNTLRSYSLSARNLDGQPAKMYVLKISTAASNRYIMQGLQGAPGGDVYKPDVRTSIFPGGVVIQSIQYTDKLGNSTSPSCMQLAFGLPFGRTYMNAACDFDQAVPPNPAKSNSQLDAMTDGRLTITLSRNGISTTRQIVVDGVSGRVTIQ